MSLDILATAVCEILRRADRVVMRKVTGKPLPEGAQLTVGKLESILQVLTVVRAFVDVIHAALKLHQPW